MLLKFVIIFFLMTGFFTSARAAPCCAGLNAVPALITGDEASFLSMGLSSGSTVADAPAINQGLPVFRDALSAKEARQSLIFNYAKLLDGDRLQAGLSIPVFVNTLENAGHKASQVSLGDISLTAGYEVLPEWDYSVWKPHVFGFFQLTLPCGKSIYDSSAILSSDVGGLGQFQTALGGVAIKRWSRFDSNFVLKLVRIFGRTFSPGADQRVSVGSSLGLNSSVGLGFSFAERMRAGLSLAPDYQSATAVNANGTSERTSFKLVWNTGLTLTYLAGMNDSVVLGYNDQTLIGPAVNTALLKAASLSFTHRIER